MSAVLIAVGESLAVGVPLVWLVFAVRARAVRREPVSCEEPAATGFRDCVEFCVEFCGELLLGLLKLVGAIVAILVMLVVLVMWMNAPTPMWRCTSTVSETGHGVTYTRCAD